jgi:hypothetical protein
MRLASFLRIIMVMLTVIQVGTWKTTSHANLTESDLLATVMTRIRHGVDVQRCRTRYLVSCSAYENGSYWLPPTEGYREEYTFSSARKLST